MVIDYTIVEGLPAQVEAKVKELLASGWCLHGETYTIQTPDRKYDLIVQSMILED